MASQLFEKSEVAEAWGGKTVWILQDVLLEYVEQATAFKSQHHFDLSRNWETDDRSDEAKRLYNVRLSGARF